MILIHLVMIIKNEEKYLERCIRSALPYVDKIFVTDTGSEDRSIEILKSLSKPNVLPVPLFWDSFKWNKDFSEARNHALSFSEDFDRFTSLTNWNQSHSSKTPDKTSCAPIHLWNLVLDADECLLKIFDDDDRYNSLPSDIVGSEEKVQKEERCYQPNQTNQANQAGKFAEDERSGKAFREYLKRMEQKHGRNWVGLLGRFDAFKSRKSGSEDETGFGYYPRLLPAGVRYKGKIHEQPDDSFKRFPTPLKARHDGYVNSNDKGKRNIEYLMDAIREEPDNPYYQYQTAVTLKNLGRTEDSIPYFRSFDSMILENKTAVIYRNQGIIAYIYALLDLGNDDALNEAREILEREKFNKDFHRDPDFYFVSGLFYMRYILMDLSGRIALLPEIEKSFLRCLEIGEKRRYDGVVGTGSFKASYNLGLWYELNGDSQKARHYYEMSSNDGYMPAREALKRLAEMKTS